MEPALMAALLLWLPALLAVFGCFNLLGRGGPIWKVLTPLCVVLVLLAPFTVPASGSTVAVDLLWGVVLLGAPLLLGLLMLVFSGDVPVGRVGRWGLPGGLALVAVALGMLVAWTPTFVDNVALWDRFVLVLLGSCASLCASFFVLHRLFVARRRSRSWPMLCGAVMATGLLFLHGVEGQAGALVVGEIAGVFLGSGLALLLGIMVVWSFERNLPEPESLPPPSDQDLERAAAIVARRLQHGGASDE
ncbi:MAG: hypothetical protein ACPGOT_00935 [Candidatus Poseidoniaceae archaeon]